MSLHVKFPIRIKLLLLMAGFTLLATISYLLLALNLFKDDKTQLVYELNASVVKTLSAQVDTNILKIIDKIKLLTQGHLDKSWTRSVIESEPLLVSYTLFQPNPYSSKWVPVSTIRNAEYLKLYGLPIDEIERIREKTEIPFSKILQKGLWVRNTTLSGGAPLFTLAVSVVVQRDQAPPIQSIAVADVRMDQILKLLSRRKIGIVYMVDAEGAVFAHPDIEWVNSQKNVSDIPIVREAIVSPVALQLKQFDWNGGRWLGAFSSVGSGGGITAGLTGLTVISQIPDSQAFLALKQLFTKSILFASIIITLSLLVSAWLAKTFTEPLSRLVVATERLSRWEFGDTLHVKSNDEIAHLARSFNTMASDLQAQREQLNAHQAELERKVAERTQELELERQKFSEAQNSLLRTTKLAALGEVAGAAAHEVLNPVNNMNIRIERISQQSSEEDRSDVGLMKEIVLGWAKAFEKGGFDALIEELKKPSENPQLKSLGEEDLKNLISIVQDLEKRLVDRNEGLGFLKKEIVRITRIVNNMRSLSRVGGERRPLDVHLPLDETALALGDLFKQKSVTLLKEYSADSRDQFLAVGDKDEWVQVFSNLVRNSLQAVVEANRRVGVVKISTLRNGGKIEIRISDNGTGISKENRSKLFETSFTTKSIEEGTGLGLSISRRIVRAFGGDIELEKTGEDEGTTFLIWFPPIT